MYYYAIAQDPWQKHTIGLDCPAYRHGRILYTALCWLCTGGNAVLLVWIMPAINLAAIAGLAWLGAWTAQRHGLSPWWGFVLPLALNVCLPALRDLTDVVSTFVVFSLLIAWLFNARWWLVVLLAAAAVFAREQNLLIVGILWLFAIWLRQKLPAIGLGAVMAAWFGWACLLRVTYGAWPMPGGPSVYGMPLGGAYYAWTHLGGFHHSTRLAICNCLSLLHLGLVVGLAIYVIIYRRGCPAVVSWVLLAGLGLAVLGSTPLWDDMYCYRRGFVWLPLGLFLTGMYTQNTRLLFLLAPAGLFSVMAALHYV
jgi:hypothetical protein